MAGLFDAETETLARAFAASSAAFLERLRWMTATLGGPREWFNSFPVPADWRPQIQWNPPAIDLLAFVTFAGKTAEAWAVAKDLNAELSKFNCETIKALLSNMLETHDVGNGSPLSGNLGDVQTLMGEIVKAVLEFHQAVERFALSLSVTTQPLTAAAAVPVATGAEFVDSDYAEPISKSDWAFLFVVNPATIRRRIQSGELRTLPGTSDTAKKVRVHGDDFPAGLKRLNERKLKLSTLPKRGKRQ